MKEIFDDESRREEHAEALRTGVALMKTLRHPNIVLMMGCCLKPPHLCLITEYVERGNLRWVLEDEHSVFSWASRVRAATDIARGLAYLHDRAIIHRDVKSLNVLVDEQWTCRISDFGIARSLPRTGKMTMARGTFDYTAPEVMAGETYDERADVYSYGMLLLEIITRSHIADVKYALANTLRNDGFPKLENLVPPRTPPVLVDIAMTCIAETPAERPSCSEIVDQLEAMIERGEVAGADAAAGTRLAEEAARAAREAHSNTPLLQRRIQLALPKDGDKATGSTASRGSEARVPSDASWEVDYNSIKFVRKIGEGGFGSVSHARWNGTDVAVKELFTDESLKPEHIKALRTEIEVNMALRHPNITLFMGGCTRKPHLCMLTEYVARGNLRDILNDDDMALTWSSRYRVARDTARGMTYLHSKGIIHRDLKSLNLLCDDTWTTKICDFGIARSVPRSRKMTVASGSFDWCAPEVLAGAEYDEKADVFSFGCVMLEIITRMHVYDCTCAWNRQVAGQGYPKLKDLCPVRCPPSFLAIATACLDKDPAERPTFASVMDMLEAVEGDIARADEGTGTWIAKQGEANAASKAAAEADSAAADASPHHMRPVAKAVLAAVQQPPTEPDPPSKLSNEEAREFWTENFGQLEHLMLQQFITLVAAEFDLDDYRLRKAREHLTHDGRGVWVTPTSFAQFLVAFGTPIEKAFTDLLGLEDAQCYHGFIDQDAAEALLNGKQNGTFLLRSSISRPGCFSVAVVKAHTGGHSEVRHSLVDKRAQGFTVDGKSFFATMVDFVAAYSWLLKVPLQRQSAA